MKIAIMGGRCGNCARFIQYYCHSSEQILCAIDSGYCSLRSRNVRPGDRCKEYQYREKQMVKKEGRCNDCRKYAPFYCAWMDEAPKEIGCGYCMNNLETVYPGDTCGEWMGKKKKERGGGEKWSILNHLWERKSLSRWGCRLSI